MKILSRKGLVIVTVMLGFFGILLSTKAQQTTGELKLEISAGQSCCVYGTSVVFGEKEVSFGITEFTGDFLSYYGTNSWGCKDLLGTETGRAMYISLSGDMANQNGNKISSGNVKISFDETILVGGNCTPYINSGTDVSLDNSVSLLEKDGNIGSNYGKICELGTTNVKLKVITNTGQAPGNYVGTLVIDLPNFANANCGQLEGTFYDAETDGLNYEGDKGSVGITSNGGKFTYKPGEQITFKIGTVTLGNPVVPAANGSVFITDLFGVARTEITDPNVIEVGKLLQGLDEDNNPDNGILLTNTGAFTESGNVIGLNVNTKLASLSKPIRTSKQIVQHLEKTAESKLEENIDINYPWIVKGGGTSPDQVSSIKISSYGNTFVGGYGVAGYYGSTNISNSGGYDIIISKINGSGEYVWAKKGGGTGYDYLNSIAVDNSENIYAIGYYNSSIANFGSTSILNSGDFDIFVSKLSSDGNWLWTKKWGGTGSDYGRAISVDADGNTYVAGNFAGIVSFDNNILVSSGGEDIFIAKLDSSGTLLWIRKLGSGANESIRSMELDSLNNIYVGGLFGSFLTVGSDVLISSGGAEFFVGKLDSNGNWLWAKKGGGTGHDYVNDIKIDYLGNLYIAGYFTVTANFGSNQLISNGEGDVFVRKLDSNGNSLWAVSGGGSGYDYANSIHTDGEGNIYVGGLFTSNAVFGSNSLVSSGSDDALLGKISGGGNWLRTKRFGAESIDRILSIDYVSGNLYVGGVFSNTTKFASNTLISSGSLDNFVRKIVDRDF